MGARRGMAALGRGCRVTRAAGGVRGALCFTLLGALACAGSGCTRRNAPYAFRTPVVAGVSAGELTLPSPMPRMAELVSDAQRGPSRQRRPDVGVIARGSLMDPGDSLVTNLRSLVGARDDRMTPTEFAVATLRGIGFPVDADLAGTRASEDLVSLASARGAVIAPDELGFADLMVFDHRPKEHEATIGMVIRRDQRGVIELIYIKDGVIRRGFADPRHPGDKRDDKGRVLNTHVRAGLPGDPVDMKYLAGQLLRTAISHQRLLTVPTS